MCIHFMTYQIPVQISISCQISSTNIILKPESYKKMMIKTRRMKGNALALEAKSTVQVIISNYRNCCGAASQNTSQQQHLHRWDSFVYYICSSRANEIEKEHLAESLSMQVFV